MQNHDIVHLTSVHSRIDTRIRYKQCASLAQRFPGQVALVVQDGFGDELDSKDDLQIIDTGKKPRSRITRILIGNWRMFRAARSQRARIAHFHDPELIAAGLVLKLFGTRVVYDIHEDVPRQLLNKRYIKSKLARQLLSRAATVAETFAVRVFDLSVPSVGSIAQRFSPKKTCIVRNFPRADLMQRSGEAPDPDECFVINYAGSLTRARGIHDLIVAMSLLPERFELHLMGTWNPPSFEQECHDTQGWAQCRYHGRKPHDEVARYMSAAHLGVQLTHDIPNHTGGLATKVFEYLFLSVPVLMSDTEEKRQTYGGLVDYAKPGDPQAIAVKIREIADDYRASAEGAARSSQVAIADYSWESEVRQLFVRYDELLAKFPLSDDSTERSK